MIEIKNISKTFKNNKVLDGIDLTINQGDVVAIIGPSGTGRAGKTELDSVGKGKDYERKYIDRMGK